MAAQSLPLDLLTADDYLRRERAAETKHEYVNGLVYAMAGASIDHNRIARNLTASLHRKLGKRPCEVFPSDMKVRIDKANVFRYPDLSALCGPVMFHDEEADSYCNPGLIIEVLSPGTEDLDRGEKFTLYRLLDSLEEYLLVSQDQYRVERFRKSEGQWSAVVFDAPEDEVGLASLGVSLTLGEIYERVEFDDDVA